MKNRPSIIAVIEPPDDEDPHWSVESPLIHYQAQGRTRSEALARFQEGLAEALDWARRNGGVRHGRQPELIEFVL